MQNKFKNNQENFLKWFMGAFYRRLLSKKMLIHLWQIIDLGQEKSTMPFIFADINGLLNTK